MNVIYEYAAGKGAYETVAKRDTTFTSYNNGLQGYKGEEPTKPQRRANMEAAMPVRRSASVQPTAAGFACSASRLRCVGHRPAGGGLWHSRADHRGRA
jgi:hypothetical protein